MKMYHPILHVVYSSVTHEGLIHISTKYHLLKDVEATFPGTSTVIDRPPLSKVGFYLYYFEVGLHVPPSSCFGCIVESYKIHTFQLKPNSISKVVCFELLCHASFFVPTMDLFQYFFCICCNGTWYYFSSRGEVSLRVSPSIPKIGRMNLFAGMPLASPIIMNFMFLV